MKHLLGLEAAILQFLMKVSQEENYEAEGLEEGKR